MSKIWKEKQQTNGRGNKRTLTEQILCSGWLVAPALVIIIVNMSLIDSRRGPRPRSRRVVVLLHRGEEAAARGGWGAPD